MRDIINRELKESIKVKEACISLADKIEKAANMIIECYKRGNKVVAFGNGGSAADAQHFVAELVNKYKLDRNPLPAIAFTTNTSILTSVGNDSSFDNIFEKQAQALCNPGDVAIAITTSDIEDGSNAHSANVYRGIIAAKKKGAKVIGLLGERSITASKLVDLPIMIPSKITSRVQESHITIIHIICELVENELFG
jgi:D-sedoheptulose 7-phosphate isomerase